MTSTCAGSLHRVSHEDLRKMGLDDLGYAVYKVAERGDYLGLHRLCGSPHEYLRARRHTHPLHTPNLAPGVPHVNDS